MSGKGPQKNKRGLSDRFDLANLNKRLQLRSDVIRCLRSISDKIDPTQIDYYTTIGGIA